MTKRFLRDRYSWVWRDFRNEAPGALVSLSSGALVGWFTAVRWQPQPATIGFWSPWSIAFVVLALVGAFLWLRRGAHHHRENPRDVGFHTLDQKIEDMDRRMEDHFKILRARPELEVAVNGEHPRSYGHTLTVPAGATVSAALGAGTLTVRVPSGLPFGVATDGPYEFTIESGTAGVSLPEGGYVTATASGSATVEGLARGIVLPPDEDD